MAIKTVVSDGTFSKRFINVPFKMTELSGLDPVQSPTLDNCGFVSTISSLAWSGSDFLDVVMPWGRDNFGDYLVFRFFNREGNYGGEWEKVTIDQNIYVKERVINTDRTPQQQRYLALFTNSRDNPRVLWPSLLEKAYVYWKCREMNQECYEKTLPFILPSDILTEMTGEEAKTFDVDESPSKFFNFIHEHCHFDDAQNDLANVVKFEEIKNRIIEKLKVPMIICTSSTDKKKTRLEYERLGLTPEHAYSILGCVQPNIIVLRDPRGYDSPRIWNPSGTYSMIDGHGSLEMKFEEDDGIVPVEMENIPILFGDVIYIDR